MKKLFLDANILFSATCSDSGASRMLFKLAKGDKVSLLSSTYAIEEALKNIEKKLGSDKLPEFFVLLSLLDDLIKNLIPSDKYNGVVPKKDLPILLAAIELDVDYLITLDKKDFKTEKVENAQLPFKIMIPGEFLQSLEN